MTVGERLVVGRIAKAHGIRGEVAVEVLTDHADRFAVDSVLQGPNGPLTVAASRPHQGRLLVLFAEVLDRNTAEALRGEVLTIAGEAAQPLPEGRWYPHQLEGLAVHLAGSGEKVGRFSHVVETPAHDLWVVRTVESREVMVPVNFVEDVDLDAKRITIAPPEGLF